MVITDPRLGQGSWGYTSITFGAIAYQKVGSVVDILYDCKDRALNEARTRKRRVLVVDTTPPVTALVGEVEVLHEGATPFIDQGMASNDTYDGNITARVVTEIRVVVALQNRSGAKFESAGAGAGAGALPPSSSSSSWSNHSNGTVVVGVDVRVPSGSVYTLTYTSTDSSGNVGVVLHRVVTIVDTTAPTIALQGEADLEWDAGVPFTDPGYTASDTLDGDLTAKVYASIVDGRGGENTLVDTDNEVGTVYTVTYTVADATGNTVTAVRTVTLTDTTPPQVKVIGGQQKIAVTFPGGVFSF